MDQCERTFLNTLESLTSSRSTEQGRGNRRSLENLARLWPSLDERKQPVPPSLKVFLVGLGFTKQVTRPPSSSFSHGRGSKLDIPKPSINSWPIPRRTSCASCRRQESSRKYFSICVPSLRFLEREPSTNLSLFLSLFGSSARASAPRGEACTLTMSRSFENAFHPPFSNIL